MVDGGQTKVPRFQPAPTGPFTPAPTEGGSGRDIGGVVTTSGGRGGGRADTTAAQQRAAEASARAAQERQKRIETARVGRVKGAIEKLEEKIRLGRVDQRQLEKLNQRVQNLRLSIERGVIGGLPEPFRVGITTRGAPILQTAQPDSFELRQTGLTKGVPQTAFFNIRTGKKASRSIQTQLREQVGSELVIGSEVRGFGIKKVKDVTFPEVVETFTTPEGIRSLSNLAGALTLEGGELLSRGTEDLIRRANKKVGIVEDIKVQKIFDLPSPISREVSTSILSDIFLFSAFAPFINTATAAKGSAKAKVVQTTKQNAKKIAKLRQLREQIAKSSETKTRDFVKREIKKIVGSKRFTQEQKSLRLKNLEIFVREARGQIQIQNGKIVPVVKLGIGDIPRKPIIKEIISETKLPAIGKIKRLESTLLATSQVEKNAERVRLAKEKNQIRIRNAKLPISQRVSETLSTSQVPAILGGTARSEFSGRGIFERTDEVLASKIGVLKSRISSNPLVNEIRAKNILNINQQRLLNVNNSLDSLTRELQRSKISQRSLTRQLNSSLTANVQNTRQQQIQKQLQKQQFLVKQISSLRLRQRSLSRFGRGKVRLRIKKPFKVKKAFKPLFPARRKDAVSKRLKRIPDKKFLDVRVRKRGKDISIGKFKDIKKARRALKKRLGTTLRASGFIFDVRKQRKIRPKVTKGFRISKVDAFRLVERRKRRLDSPNEVKKIQQAKKAKKAFKPVKSNMKSTKLIKKRRKK